MQIHKYAHFDHFSWLYNPFWWTILTHPRVGLLGLYGVFFQMLYFEISLVTAYILVARCQRHVIDWNQLPTKTQLSGIKHWTQLWTSAMCVDCSCLIGGKPVDERPPVKWERKIIIDSLSTCLYSFICFTNSQQSSINKPGVREGRCGGDGSERQVW